MVEVGGRRVAVRARLVSGAERERLRGLLVRAWPAYETYERRAEALVGHLPTRPSRQTD